MKRDGHYMKVASSVGIARRGRTKNNPGRSSEASDVYKMTTIYSSHHIGNWATVTTISPHLTTATTTTKTLSLYPHFTVVVTVKKIR